MIARITVSFIILAVFMIGCIKRVERPPRMDSTRYFPLSEGDAFVYTATPGEAIVTRQIDNLFTKTYYDSAGNEQAWEDYILRNDGVYLNNLAFGDARLPAVHFIPSLPFSPWSDFVGDTLLVTATEIRSDSVNSHLRIQVEYEIMAVERVTTPAGTFEDCIKVRMAYTPLGDAGQRLIAPEIYRWFAPDVGIVKFQTTLVTGELTRAVVGGFVYP
ncbi:MAG: hypothetical protein JSV44_05855 [Candidatus Zixiibacteriota bacterium]|nr:MAG: hypothetical protein JSV44_05855 [candidate division Zixibacteria bacterium]